MYVGITIEYQGPTEAVAHSQKAQALLQMAAVLVSLNVAC